MNINSEVSNFQESSAIDKSRFLARFMYEMTLEARNFYSSEGEQSIDTQRLRFVNEVQHRVTRFIEQLLSDDPGRPTDDVMIRLLLAPRAEKTIEALVYAAWSRAVQSTS